MGERFARWAREKFWPALLLQVRRHGRIIYFAGREFKRDNCVIRAAALSFVMLLSLVPATFVFFIILNAVGAFEKYGQKLREAMADQIVPKAQQFDSVRQWINSTIDRLVSQVSGDITGISFNVVSFGAMIITAALLLAAIEKTMNGIWAVKVKRGPLKQLSNIWMIITLGPVFIFFLYYFGLLLYTHMTAEVATESWFYNSFIFLLPYLSSMLAFYLLFQLVPFTAVRANAAFTGAIFSGIVWEFSKVPFTEYVSHVINPTGVYGPLGVLPFFLLWVYLTWVIALFGAEISYCKQHYRIISSAHSHDEHFISLYKSYFTIRVISEAVMSFDSGRGPVKVSRLARRLKMPLDLCRELAENLRRKNLLIYHGHDRKRFHLARPSDKITLKDALAGVPASRLEVPPHADTPADGKIRELFSEINRHREKSLSSVTFAQLLETPRQEQ